MLLKWSSSSSVQSNCQSLMKNKSSTSPVGLARKNHGSLKEQTLTFYKNHKKPSLSAGTRNRRKKEIMIIWVNKICWLYRNLFKWKVDCSEASRGDLSTGQILENIELIIPPTEESGHHNYISQIYGTGKRITCKLMKSLVWKYLHTEEIVKGPNVDNHIM